MIEEGLPPLARRAVLAFIAERLAQEHPEFFKLRRGPEGASLDCSLTGERLAFDSGMNLLSSQSGAAASPPYDSALDALACQVQEDLAITTVEGAANRLSALHLCFPSHWAARAKIGADFNSVHSPVAGFEKLAKTSDALLRALVEKGPYVRFAWTLSTDRRLNHHPDPPPGVPKEAWHGRGFGEVERIEDLFLRIERQCLVGFPLADCFLFTIRLSHRSCADLSPDERANLRAALESMPSDSRAYKGVLNDFGHLMRLLGG